MSQKNQAHSFPRIGFFLTWLTPAFPNPRLDGSFPAAVRLLHRVEQQLHDVAAVAAVAAAPPDQRALFPARLDHDGRLQQQLLRRDGSAYDPLVGQPVCSWLVVYLRRHRRTTAPARAAH